MKSLAKELDKKFIDRKQYKKDVMVVAKEGYRWEKEFFKLQKEYDKLKKKFTAYINYKKKLRLNSIPIAEVKKIIGVQIENIELSKLYPKKNTPIEAWECMCNLVIAVLKELIEKLREVKK